MINLIYLFLFVAVLFDVFLSVKKKCRESSCGILIMKIMKKYEEQGNKTQIFLLKDLITDAD